MFATNLVEGLDESVVVKGLVSVEGDDVTEHGGTGKAGVVGDLIWMGLVFTNSGGE